MRRARPEDITPRTREGEIALRAALAGGRLLRAEFNQSREVISKGYRNPVTDADFKAQRIVSRILTGAFPEYALLSEEDAARPSLSGAVWVVDPLDGTTNYLRRIPNFSISIALVRRGKPQVGVVFDPMRDECFFAERGRGAWLNGMRVHASRTKTHTQAVVGCELSRAQSLRQASVRMFARLAETSLTARVCGSSALSLCYVGAGRLDSYFHLSLSTWDVAAGLLFCQEGGGRVTRPDGKPATVDGGAYIAGNPDMHRYLLDQFKNRPSSRHLESGRRSPPSES